MRRVAQRDRQASDRSCDGERVPVEPLDHDATCSLSARPLPVTDFLTGAGEYSATSIPGAAEHREDHASRMGQLQRRAGADPVERGLDRGEVGVVDEHERLTSWMAASRSAKGCRAPSRITPPSMHAAGRGFRRATPSR